MHTCHIRDSKSFVCNIYMKSMSLASLLGNEMLHSLDDQVLFFLLMISQQVLELLLTISGQPRYSKVLFWFSLFQ